MKSSLSLIIVCLLFSCLSQAQIRFESGYFINESNEKIECLIKNFDWKNNPSEFQFKLTNDSEVQTGTTKTTKEFGIYNGVKYVSSLVKIDRSSESINHLSTDEKPIFKEEQLFLKVLLEGEANLFLYEFDNSKKYYFSNSISTIQPLIYKRYKVDESNLKVNDQYKEQLFINLQCSDLTINDFKYLSYDKRGLIKIFTKYYQCKNSNYKIFENEKDRDILSLKLKAGLRSASFLVRNNLTNYRNIDFEKKTNPIIGMEAEFSLPYNNGKWSILIKPTFQKYNAKSEMQYGESLTTRDPFITDVEVNYRSIEIPIGLRYYSFINDKSSLFFNVSYTFDSPFSSKIGSEERPDILDIKIDSKNNFTLGLGYEYNKKLSLELEYGFSRNLMKNFISYSSEYDTFSVFLGYKFL